MAKGGFAGGLAGGLDTGMKLREAKDKRDAARKPKFSATQAPLPVSSKAQMEGPVADEPEKYADGGMLGTYRDKYMPNIVKKAVGRLTGGGEKTESKADPAPGHKGEQVWRKGLNAGEYYQEDKETLNLADGGPTDLEKERGMTDAQMDARARPLADKVFGFFLDKKPAQAKSDTTNRRRQLDKEIDKYADGGQLGVTYSEKPKQETMGGVSGKKVENREAGKRPPTPPAAIGVRGSAPDFRTEVTAFLADGGQVEQPMGYANGGMTYAGPVGNPVFGYTQHASEIVTSDPLWHMECHRDFGKKG